MLSDSQLLRAYSVDGSQEAFGELVQRHLPLVYRSALRQLSFDTHRAEDVSQLVFLSLARQAPQLIAHTHLPAWLYSTTHRTACQVLRTEMRRRKREQVWLEQTDVAPNAPEAASAWTQVAPALDEAMRALGAKDREAVLLRFFSDRSFSEIGVALRIGEDAARMRVNRALEKLRELLGRRGVSVTSSALAGLIASDTALGAPAGLASTIAGAAAQTTPVAVTIGSAWVAFMAGSKLITTVAVLLAAVAVGVSWQQLQAHQITALELQSQQDEIAALRGRIEMAGRRVAAAKVRSTPVAAPAVNTAFDEAVAAERAKGDQFLAAHPEVREALTQSQRAKVRGRFLLLYRELKLTEAQIEDFENLLVGASGRSWPNAGVLWLGEPLSPDERNRRIRALLGDDGFARYHAMYMKGIRSLDSGDAVAHALATRLAFKDEPLTRQKSIMVRDIFDAACAENSSGGDAWTDALPLLASVLTRAQMDEMNAVCAESRYLRAQAAAKK